jgi:hypothetical protein
MEGSGDLAAQGRTLAAVLSKLPGFISFVMLESGTDGIASMTIFDDAVGLRAGDAVITSWLLEHMPAVDVAATKPLLSGEIVAQRGL